MGSEYSQTGRSARRRLTAKKQARTTELDQRDQQDYDTWLREAHLNTKPIPTTKESEQ